MQRSDYNFAALSEAQYTAIVQAGSMGGTSPMLGSGNYTAFVAACEGINCDPRVLLAGLQFEDHFGCDPVGAAAASVNNLSGIKWAGQSSATDSGIAADNGGTYAKFATLADFFGEYARTMVNSYVGPSFQSGDLVQAWAIYVGGPNAPNVPAGQERVQQWQYFVAHYPSGDAPAPPPAKVTGQDVLNIALAHLGDTWETDRNGTHPVSMWCEATVEDWHQWAGAPQPAYVSALAAAQAKPLSQGIAPAGALVFFQGSQWSVYGHVGLGMGDGRTISGLASVVISAGWQDPAQGYMGWRYGDGVGAPRPDSGPFYQEGNPYGAVPLLPPFWNRWYALELLKGGLGTAMMGWAVRAEQTNMGRRIQQFERNWYGVQDAPDPWNVVALLPGEEPK